MGLIDFFLKFLTNCVFCWLVFWMFVLTLVGDPWVWWKFHTKCSFLGINCGVRRLVLAGGEMSSAFLSVCEWIVKGLLICSLLHWSRYSQILAVMQGSYLHHAKNGLGEGYLGNRIIRCIKNRNTWPCLLLFPVSLETVLTVLLSSQVLFWKGWLEGRGLLLPHDLPCQEPFPSVLLAFHCYT